MEKSAFRKVMDVLLASHLVLTVSPYVMAGKTPAAVPQRPAHPSTLGRRDPFLPVLVAPMPPGPPQDASGRKTREAPHAQQQEMLASAIGMLSQPEASPAHPEFPAFTERLLMLKNKLVGSVTAEDLQRRKRAVLRDISSLLRSGSIQRDFLAKKLNIQGIVYQEPHPVALVNQRIVRKGDQLEAGLFVTDIQTDCIVFTYQGQVFQRCLH